ncbi:unnamed protein product [Closterium sp. NIES-54]
MDETMNAVPNDMGNTLAQLMRQLETLTLENRQVWAEMQQLREIVSIPLGHATPSPAPNTSTGAEALPERRSGLKPQKPEPFDPSQRDANSGSILSFLTLPCLRCPTCSALPVPLPACCLARDPLTTLLALCPALPCISHAPCPVAHASPCPAARASPCPAARASPYPAARAPPCPAARTSPCPAARGPPCPAARTSPCPAARASPCPAARASLCPVGRAPPCPAARAPHCPAARALPCSPRVALPCSSRDALPARCLSCQHTALVAHALPSPLHCPS